MKYFIYEWNVSKFEKFDTTPTWLAIVVIPCNHTLPYELKSHINHLLIKNSYLFAATSRNYQSSGLRISELFNIALAVIKIENASRIGVSLINDNHTRCEFYNEWINYFIMKETSNEKKKKTKYLQLELVSLNEISWMCTTI